MPQRLQKHLRQKRLTAPTKRTWLVSSFLIKPSKHILYSMLFQKPLLSLHILLVKQRQVFIPNYPKHSEHPATLDITLSMFLRLHSKSTNSNPLSHQLNCREVSRKKSPHILWALGTSLETPDHW